MKYEQIEGQLSLFEDPKSLFHEKKEELINPIFEELVERYRYTCARIAKVENKLYVEVGGQTLSFEPTGEAAGIFVRDMLLRPKDEILVANEYKPINDKQIKTLKKIQTDKLIKRKSDSNILIQYDNFCMAIYPSGHFAKWKSPAVFKDDEVYSMEEIENINDMFSENKEDLKEVEEIEKSEEVLKLGDKVSFDYDGPQVGEIVRIYNNGETVNVCWNNKQTAFYYKHVYKITR